MKLPRTAKHGSSNIIHSVFQHAFSSYLRFHPKNVFGGDAAIFLQDFDRFVFSGPFTSTPTDVFLDASFAVGCRSDLLGRQK
jgi:hypothetical protein